MSWQIELQKLEQAKDWDSAIDLLHDAIATKKNNLDAYLSMNYLLMHLLVEEDYGNKHDYYAYLLKKYFDESYKKFHDNAEFIFFMGVIAHMAEWYFDIEIEEAIEMIKKASCLEPENPLFQWGYYVYPDMSDYTNQKLALPFANQILEKDSFIRKSLESRGSLGEYFLVRLPSWMEDVEEYARKLR